MARRHRGQRKAGPRRRLRTALKHRGDGQIRAFALELRGMLDRWIAVYEVLREPPASEEAEHCLSIVEVKNICAAASSNNRDLVHRGSGGNGATHDRFEGE